MLRDLAEALSAMPPPPGFMRECPLCCVLLDELAEDWVRAASDPFYDGALRVQIRLARHLAVEHTDAVPAPHTDGCETCARFEQRSGPGDVFWGEHLARGLFLTPELARLM